jgi:hypothetical protein
MDNLVRWHINASKTEPRGNRRTSRQICPDIAPNSLNVPPPTGRLTGPWLATNSKTYSMSRRFQFSLRLLMVGVTYVAVVLGLLMVLYRQISAELRDAPIHVQSWALPEQKQQAD